MTDTQFHPTACNLCYANCGVLVQLDDTGTQIVKVRGDKAHPISKGYTCNKAARINYYQNGKDRLTPHYAARRMAPLRKLIGTRLLLRSQRGFSKIKREFGGDKIMYYGGGGQGNHLGGAYSTRFVARSA